MADAGLRSRPSHLARQSSFGLGNFRSESDNFSGDFGCDRNVFSGDSGRGGNYFGSSIGGNFSGKFSGDSGFDDFGRSDYDRLFTEFFGGFLSEHFRFGNFDGGCDGLSGNFVGGLNDFSGHISSGPNDFSGDFVLG